MYYNLAPNIFRKRLIIEGRYQKTIHSLDFLYNFLLSATSLITDADRMKKGLRGPFVFDYDYGTKLYQNSSYDGFVIWNEHQLGMYIWKEERKLCPKT